MGIRGCPPSRSRIPQGPLGAPAQSRDPRAVPSRSWGDRGSLEDPQGSDPKQIPQRPLGAPAQSLDPSEVPKQVTGPIGIPRYPRGYPRSLRDPQMPFMGSWVPWGSLCREAPRADPRSLEDPQPPLRGSCVPWGSLRGRGGRTRSRSHIPQGCSWRCSHRERPPRDAHGTPRGESLRVPMGCAQGAAGAGGGGGSAAGGRNRSGSRWFRLIPPSPLPPRALNPRLPAALRVQPWCPPHTGPRGRGNRCHGQRRQPPGAGAQPRVPPS